ncbi:gamma-aminobutyric acid type B receptor subunit 2 [Patella vulgata]|uniref:gamma-aminobutyric acid type B receptor subunit 2 n=1 Tax=Patella vulgata TaxID=6465 RepID=UPI0024A94DF1|nr:gamma-aminobutyric acid type B receptor subunit 2 [Patella vulgata]
MADQTEFLISRSHPWAYDAAYAVALSLNATEDKLQNVNKSLAMFNYNDSLTLEYMRSSIEDVSFNGVSGPVSFTNDGGRVGIAYIEYNHRRPAPRDRFIYVEIYEPYDVTAVYCVLFSNTIGVIIAFVFLAFNTIYRNNRHIKMSSPYINNVIILGGLVMFVAVYVNTMDYARFGSKHFDENICMVKLWLSLLGFTLAFGALFSKTWRVHILFRETSLKKKCIKDYQLIGMLLALTLVDLCILGPWTIFHPLHKEEIKIKSEADSDSDNVVTFIYTACKHRYDIYWYASEYIYKGLLLVFGVFLAWETRMVSIPALNDSKLIGFCVYNIVVVCAFGVPVAHVLSIQQTTLMFVLTSVFTIFCTTLVLCILFIPKLKLRNEIGDIRFVKSLQTGNCSGSFDPSQDSNLKRPPLTAREPVTVNRPVGLIESKTFAEVCKELAVLKQELLEEENAVNQLKVELSRKTNNQINFHKVDGRYTVFKQSEQNEADM